MRKRIIALLLALILTVGLLPTVALAATGDEETTANPITNPGSQTAGGVTLSKTATKNDDGTYTIRLEAYARGSSTTTETTEEVPTDIILVLDRSGSMSEKMGAVKYSRYEGRQTRNDNLYDNKDNLYYQLKDGSYVKVTVERKQEDIYTAYPGNTTNGTYYDDSNDYWDPVTLYAQTTDGYKEVKVDREKKWVKDGYWRYRSFFTYTLTNNTKIASDIKGSNTVPTFDRNSVTSQVLYTKSTQNVYTYTYKDAAGQKQLITTSTGDSTELRNKTPMWYQWVDSDGGDSKMEALKDAASNFVDSVAKKAAGTNGKTVDHRIAVVSFASDVANNTNGFKQMKNPGEAAAVKQVIRGLTADGGTLVDNGINTANAIFADNQIQSNEKRNRVVIVFTDGAPGLYGNWEAASVNTANSAIAAANTSKKTHGATVFTIGIFAGAKNDLPIPAYIKYDNYYYLSDAQKTQNSNRFMHLVSTNYPAATNITTPNTQNSKTGYYLTASDSASLNNVFQQISNQIQNVTTTDLDANAVVTDTVGESFSFAGTAQSYAVKVAAFEKLENGQYTFSSIETTDSNVKATITGKTISVTGFNFEDEWCGYDTNGNMQTPNGHKLIIELTVAADAAGCDTPSIPTNNGNAKILDKDGKTAVEIGSPTVQGYRVAYDDGVDDNTVTKIPEPSKYFITSTTVASETPTRAGYTFEGWKVEGGDDTLLKANDEVTFNGHDVDLIAQWTPKQQKVDLGTFVKKQFSMTEGETLTSPETFKVTVTQTSPAAAEGTPAPSYEGTVEVAKNGTYDFTFTQKPTLIYGVDYEFSVTEVSGQNTKIAYDDETHTLRLKLKEVIGENDEKQIVADGNTVTIQNSYTETYTLIYDANGGTGVPTDTKAYTSGETANLTFSPLPTHADDAAGSEIVFLGWSATKDETIHDTEPNNLIYDITMNENKTVYAVWGYDKNKNGNPDFYDATATYKIVNGMWSDSSTTKTEIVKVKEKNANSQWVSTNNKLQHIPSTTDDVIPNSGYTQSGNWDTTPSSESVFTQDTTYTYTLQRTEKVTVTYEWTGLTGVMFDEDHKAPTCPGQDTVDKGTTYTVNDDYTSTSTVTDVDGNTYTFSGWDKSGTFAVQENTIIRGTWTKSTDTFELDGKIFKSFTAPDDVQKDFYVTVTPQQGDTTDTRTGTLNLTGGTTTDVQFNFNNVSRITFTEPGTYTYLVEEAFDRVAHPDGIVDKIHYDTKQYLLTITVDTVNGNLTVDYGFTAYPQTDGEAVPKDTITFRNSYFEDPNADIVTLDLSKYVTKTFESRHGKSATETFEAKVEIWLDDVQITTNAAEEENSIAVYAEPEWPKEYTGIVTLSTGETKSFDFGNSIKLDCKHRYRIRVTETAGSNTDVEYDTTEYETYFNFNLNKEINWYKYGGDFSFTNTYTGIDDYYPIIIPTIINKDTGMLNKTDHFAYVIGYPDGTVHPNGQITRAEVATIFFRLLRDEVRDGAFTTSNTYSDVAYGKWYNNPISTMSALGIITGYPDGTFKPNKPITRAEFAAIAARFDETQSGKSATFSDVIGHWAAKEIGIAYYNDWIKGYPDGTFKPDQNITRAEAMTLINRVLERKPESPADLLTNMNKWTDNLDTSKWYYLDVQEATNSHGYTHKTFNYELWRQMLPDPDWSRYER